MRAAPHSSKPVSSGTISHKDKCIKEMVQAASKRGFFEVVNHGVPTEVLGGIQSQLKEIFDQPFNKKAAAGPVSSMPLADSYCWGEPNGFLSHPVILVRSLPRSSHRNFSTG